jgi:hypothetical protein
MKRELRGIGVGYSLYVDSSVLKLFLGIIKGK